MLNSTLWCRVGLTAVAFLLLGSRAYADIGLPMIFLALPAMLIAFIPVVLLEGFVIHKTLDLKFTRVSVVSTVSNLVSTIIGIPVTWIILVIMEMVIAGGRGYGYETLTDKFMTAVAQAPWLVPYEDQYGWMIPTAFLVLLIPFFVM